MAPAASHLYCELPSLRSRFSLHSPVEMMLLALLAFLTSSGLQTANSVGDGQVAWVEAQEFRGSAPVWTGADLPHAAPAVLGMQPATFQALVGDLLDLIWESSVACKDSDPRGGLLCALGALAAFHCPSVHLLWSLPRLLQHGMHDLARCRCSPLSCCQEPSCCQIVFSTCAKWL